MASGGWNRHLSRLQVVQEKKYLKCCVDGRPFGEGLYPPVPVPFSPNQSDLQTYDIFFVFSATDLHFKSCVVFQLKNAEALRWISLHVPRSGGMKGDSGFLADERVDVN